MNSQSQIVQDFEKTLDIDDFMEKNPSQDEKNQAALQFCRTMKLNCDTEPLERLISNGVSSNLKDSEDKSLLMFAAEKGKLELVELLLNNQANVRMKDKHGRTPLFYAIDSKDIATVSFLVGSDADINHEADNRTTPLIKAVEKENLDIIRLLLEKGAKIDGHFDNYGDSALHIAIKKNNQEIVKLLCQEGGSLKKKNKNKQSPVELAKDKPEILKILEQYQKDNKPEATKVKNEHTYNSNNSNNENISTSHTRHTENYSDQDDQNDHSPSQPDQPKATKSSSSPVNKSEKENQAHINHHQDKPSKQNSINNGNGANGNQQQQPYNASQRQSLNNQQKHKSDESQQTDPPRQTQDQQSNKAQQQNSNNNWRTANLNNRKKNEQPEHQGVGPAGNNNPNNFQNNRNNRNNTQFNTSQGGGVVGNGPQGTNNQIQMLNKQQSGGSGMYSNNMEQDASGFGNKKGKKNKMNPGANEGFAGNQNFQQNTQGGFKAGGQGNSQNAGFGNQQGGGFGPQNNRFVNNGNQQTNQQLMGNQGGNQRNNNRNNNNNNYQQDNFNAHGGGNAKFNQQGGNFNMMSSPSSGNIPSNNAQYNNNFNMQYNTASNGINQHQDQNMNFGIYNQGLNNGLVNHNNNVLDMLNQGKSLGGSVNASTNTINFGNAFVNQQYFQQQNINSKKFYVNWSDVMNVACHETYSKQIHDNKKEQDKIALQFADTQQKLTMEREKNGKLRELLGQKDQQIEQLQKQIEQLEQTIKTKNTPKSLINQEDKSTMTITQALVTQNVSPIQTILDEPKINPDIWKVDTISQLHSEILEFQDVVNKFNEEKQNLFDALIKNIRNDVSDVIPGAECCIYGSFATGLCLPWSDIDITIKVPNQMYHHQSLLDNIEMQLRKKKYVEEVKSIRNTSVPVLKITCNSNYLNKKIDISIYDNRHNGLACVDLVKEYLQHYPPLKPLALALKQYLYTLGLNDTYSGGLSSYGLILMIVFMFQIKDHQRGTNGLENNGLGHLFLSFLQTYGFDFDYINSPIYPSRLAKNKETNKFEVRFPEYNPMLHQPYVGIMEPKIIIQDPLAINNNVGRSTFQIREIKNGFIAAYMACNQPCLCEVHKYIKDIEKEKGSKSVKCTSVFRKILHSYHPNK